MSGGCKWQKDPWRGRLRSRHAPPAPSLARALPLALCRAALQRLQRMLPGAWLAACTPAAVAVLAVTLGVQVALALYFSCIHQRYAVA